MGEENGPEDYDLFTGVEEAKHRISLETNLKPIDRPRGILSPTDRDYLCGLKDYSHNQTELNRQQSIRERTIEGIRDFDILWLLLEESEREKVMDALGTEEVDASFASIISFFYLGLDRDLDRIENIIEQGIYRAENYNISGRWSGGASEVSVNIDIDHHPDADKLYMRLKRGEEDQLTPAEIGTLVRAGKLDAEDLEALEKSTSRFPKVFAGGALEQTNDT